MLFESSKLKMQYRVKVQKLSLRP